jgi:hypothetical protein
MMRSLTLLALLLAACGHRPPTAEECKALAEPKAFLSRCMGGKINGDYVGDLKCWPFSNSKRIQGVWLVQFEGSEFYSGAKTAEEAKRARPTMWLETRLRDKQPFLDAGQGGQPLTYWADVEGRESQCDAAFGHQAQFPREFIVAHFYALRRLPTVTN